MPGVSTQVLTGLCFPASSASLDPKERVDERMWRAGRSEERGWVWEEGSSMTGHAMTPGVHTAPKKDCSCSQVEPNINSTPVKLYIKGDYKQQHPIKQAAF